MIWLTKQQKQSICNEMNPEGSNYKDCNFFRVIDSTEEGKTVEVGYWITYIGCKPKYNKEVRFFSGL